MLLVSSNHLVIKGRFISLLDLLSYFLIYSLPFCAQLSLLCGRPCSTNLRIYLPRSWSSKVYPPIRTGTGQNYKISVSDVRQLLFQNICDLKAEVVRTARTVVKHKVS
jgi:hypothetical protein